MIYLDSVLCLEYNEIVPAIMVKGTFDSNKGRGNITVHGTGGNGRTIYVEYESLPSKYKAKVVDVFGCPYKYALKQPILNSIEHDQHAQDFYTNYTLPNGLKLPSSDFDLAGKPQINYVNRYTTAANWCNMLLKLTADKTTLKKEFNISVMDFWQSVGTLIKAKSVKLPASRKHLLPKLKEYASNGYETLIETHKFGNSFSAKVCDELSEAVLFKMLSLRNKLDYTEVALEYNKWALENKYEPITPEAVGYRAKKWHLELYLEREGMGKTVTKYSKRIQRDRASAPLLLINGDDNVLDVFYKNWHRPVLYVVIDTFNDYILGYAVGETVTIELVKEAYRNANKHIMELTGDSYQWQQLQTDRWAISGKNTTDLEKFYNSTTPVFFPSGIKTKGSNYVEQSFGTVWHQTLKKMFPHNYAGHNITAKQRLNPDTLKQKNFPSVENAADQIKMFIEVMRRTTRKNSELNRQQEWLHTFNASEKSKKRVLSEEQRLQIFGIRNTKYNSLELQTNKITPEGVKVSINNTKHVYELSQLQIAKHNGTSVNVIYDKDNLDTVLLTDGKQLRVLANKYKNVKSAIADYEEGDAERIKMLQAEKKTLAPLIQQKAQEVAALLQRKEIDIESRIQAGVLVKEITHSDQKYITAKNNGAKVIDLVDDEEEIDIYKQMRGN